MLKTNTFHSSYIWVTIKVLVGRKNSPVLSLWRRPYTSNIEKSVHTSTFKTFSDDWKFKKFCKIMLLEVWLWLFFEKRGVLTLRLPFCLPLHCRFLHLHSNHFYFLFLLLKEEKVHNRRLLCSKRMLLIPYSRRIFSNDYTVHGNLLYTNFL